jgi:ABC-type nitrate/sulfonate/bicarbonate transport system permease component
VVNRQQLRRFASAMLSVTVVIAAVLLWERATLGTRSLFVKPPSEIGEALRAQVADHGLLGEHALPSVSRMLRGLGLGILVGITLGTLLGRRPHLAPWMAPVLNVARSVPPPALIGVLFVAFGPGDGPKVFLVFLATVFPILFNAADGAASVDPVQLDAARALGIRRRDIVVRIVLPSAAPKVLAAIKASTSIALIVVVTSEVTGSVNGLGRVLADAQQAFRWQDVWAVLVVLAAVGLLLSIIVTLLERWLLGPWTTIGGGDDD